MLYASVRAAFRENSGFEVCGSSASVFAVRALVPFRGSWVSISLPRRVRGVSVGSWSFDVFNDDDIHGSFCRYDVQPELLA